MHVINANSKPSAIIWDWNGTLLDDLDFSVYCLNILLSDFGYTQRYSKEQYHEIFDFPIINYYKSAGFDFEKHPFDILAKRFMEHYIKGSIKCNAKKSAHIALNAFRDAGIKQVILSASPRDLLIEQVTARRLDGYFNEMLGLTDIYARSKVELGKNWISQSGIDIKNAVMIGDTSHDAEVAAAMGVRCILHSGGHHNTTTLAKTGCSIVNSLADLPDLLLH